MKSEDQKIHSLIEQNERLVQLAIVAAEDGEEQAANDILNTLYEIFKKIYAHKSENPEKYYKLVDSEIPSLSSLAQLYGSKDDFYNRYTYIGNYRLGFHKIWVQLFSSRLLSGSSSLILKVQRLLQMLASDPDNENQITEFLFLLSQISTYGLSKSNSTNLMYLTGPTYQWYFNVALTIDDERKFKLKYLPTFDSYFWASFKRIVYFENFALFKSFVSTLLQGSNSSLFSRRPIYHYFSSTGVPSSTLKDISSLDRRLLGITELTEFQEMVTSIEETIEKYKDHIDEGVTPANITEQLHIDAERIYKSNNIRVYTYLFGAYLVFKERYDWINYLWEYQQPKDADATWGLNSILPGDLYSVFNYLLHEHSYRARVEFAWEEHHGISSYYKRYGILLLARLFVIPRMYVFQDQILEPNILLTNIKLTEYDHVIELCDRLQGAVAIIDKVDSLKAKKVKYGGNEVALKDAVVSLLKKIRDSAVVQQKRIKEMVQITDEDRNAFYENINFNYLNENQLAKILAEIKLLEVEDAQNVQPPLDIIEFSLSRNKQDFVTQWQAYGATIGFESARNLAYLISARLISKMSTHPTTVAKELDEENLKELEVFLSEWTKEWGMPVIIGIGINFHSYLWNNKNFQPTSGEDKGEKIGVYIVDDKTVEIYNLSNWAYTNSFIILDAQNFGTLKLVKPAPENGYTVKEHLKASYSEPVDDNGDRHVLFNFTINYKLDLQTTARVIRVRVHENLN